MLNGLLVSSWKTGHLQSLMMCVHLSAGKSLISGLAWGLPCPAEAVLRVGDPGLPFPVWMFQLFLPGDTEDVLGAM